MTDYRQRFAGIQRLYGTAPAALLPRLHVCVIGLGGVGSWAVEALARSGVGQLTLIDFDVIKPGNTNRQLHTLNETLGRKKFAVLAGRVRSINPECRCHTIDDFLSERNVRDYLAPRRGYDYVIDAIDSIRFKAAMIHHCRRNKIPIITTGGAGGLTDPTAIKVADLSRTYNDPLAAKVRKRLRSGHRFPTNPKRYFGVDCVFSTQQPVYPRPDGGVSSAKPGIHGISLDCRYGYGSASFVTACFGFAAASRVINKTLQKRASEAGEATPFPAPPAELLSNTTD
ncbi:MAG TPA: tRNA cyclic N6-threonylcarbamoyladenosine(37) synthase TcdA [Gammaproteobacteria bacterium]|nr:tRNA cyclic N6-threonylcarbamoyladenosine(37) synthase TcdA [Gammaproteobacteria bacterium]